MPDDQLQKIAAEVHLPATTLLLKDKGDHHIRWFTPEYEIDLCGHSTLASGYVIFNVLEPKLNQSGALFTRYIRYLVSLFLHSKSKGSIIDKL